ncbi:hypothetical protein BH09SUM1_BH09SUM1_16720 [soil metagenome]
MFGDGSLTFQEFMTHEPLPLARIHDTVLEFLKGREDAVLFGAQAVNAYVDEPRMTQDVDVMSTRGPELAEEIRQHLADAFHIAVRTRNVRDGLGYRIYQVQKERNRHLVDVRPVTSFPPTQRVEGILVPVPEELIANKVFSFSRRRHKEKGLSDRLDLARLLNAFPNLKEESGPVRDQLMASEADEGILTTWKEIVHEDYSPEDDGDEFER